MVAKTDENEGRQRRMSQARRVFVLALKHVVEAEIATPVEAASAMGSVAIGVAFAAQGCDMTDVDPVNACCQEVTDVIRRHVGEWLDKHRLRDSFYLAENVCRYEFRDGQWHESKEGM